MRKIKFRAWSNKYKRMFRVNEISIELNGYTHGTVYASWVGRVNFTTPPDGKTAGLFQDPNDEPFILMQYTGLKDRNSREIYEGDIIRDDDGFLWRVYFEDGKFRARGGEYVEVDDLNEFCPYWCTVIGNIYENPELLKGDE